MRAAPLTFAATALAAIAARLCHLGILWVEEACPATAGLAPWQHRHEPVHRTSHTILDLLIKPQEPALT